ncbi:DUF4367 domain-containing protein [Sutcliffiella horikoshii]|uniref:DUF4367 domain-containing protein n=1 Tax=Sutcliffiella horikoshii TaxID=79883 RepID=A0A5D4SXZ6_9BACI|nr:DUF4367 domain-containing protein [Sutcliffiella horikoshii]TYS68253.1 DUF4367 domain-containing protein [Sutcliffiella horikoshii]
MTKRKITGMAILLTFLVGLIVGWSTWKGKLYEYDHETFQSIAASLTFENKVPMEMPFKGLEVSQRNFEKEKEKLNVTLTNINKETLEVYIGKEPKESFDELVGEEVQINNSRGTFISKDSGKSILAWQENDVHYQITYFYKLTPKEVSKKALIRMAEGFA